MKNEDKTGKESLTSFVNEGNSFGLSEPQLPHLYTGGKVSQQGCSEEGLK